jgi:hypothetical protein
MPPLPISFFQERIGTGLLDRLRVAVQRLHETLSSDPLTPWDIQARDELLQVHLREVVDLAADVLTLAAKAGIVPRDRASRVQ